MQEWSSIFIIDSKKRLFSLSPIYINIGFFLLLRRFIYNNIGIFIHKKILFIFNWIVKNTIFFVLYDNIKINNNNFPFKSYSMLNFIF